MSRKSSSVSTFGLLKYSRFSTTFQSGFWSDKRVTCARRGLYQAFRDVSKTVCVPSLANLAKVSLSGESSSNGSFANAAGRRAYVSLRLIKSKSYVCSWIAQRANMPVEPCSPNNQRRLVSSVSVNRFISKYARNFFTAYNTARHSRLAD